MLAYRGAHPAIIVDSFTFHVSSPSYLRLSTTRSPPEKSSGNLQFIHHSFQQKYQKDLIEWYINTFGSQIKLPKRNLLLLVLHQTTSLKGICLFFGSKHPKIHCFLGKCSHWCFLCRSVFFWIRIRSWVTLGRWSSSAPQQLTRHPVEPSPRPFSRPRDHVTNVTTWRRMDGWMDGFSRCLFFCCANTNIWEFLGFPKQFRVIVSKDRFSRIDCDQFMVQTQKDTPGSE